MVRLTFVLAVVAALGTSPAGALAGLPDSGPFRTPSGFIGCYYGPGFLRCDVDGGVRPAPPQPKGCQLDWGQGFEMKPTGPAEVVCAGDTTRGGTGPVVRYGTTWRHGSFACSSSTSGLRCTNASGRGFFLSKGRAYRF